MEDADGASEAIMKKAEAIRKEQEAVNPTEEQEFRAET